MSNKNLALSAIISTLIFGAVITLPNEIFSQTKRVVRKTTAKRKVPVKKATIVESLSFTPKYVGSSNIVRGNTAPNVVSEASTSDKPKIVELPVINGRATVLSIPVYPPAAKAVRAQGAVNVQVTIDEQGKVISASAVSGHPLLRQAAEQAAIASKFSPTILSGQPVRVIGIIVYNFVPQ